MASSELTEKEKTINKPIVSISYDSILAAVKTWTKGQQAMLLTDIYQILHENVGSGINLEEFWRELPSDILQLTDEEIEEIKIQWRLEKYS